MTLYRALLRCLATLVVCAYAAGTAHALKRLGPGDLVRDARVYTEALAPVSLSQLLGEKGALVVFWASWNPRSPEALAHIAGLDERYRPQGLRVVPVNVEHEGLSREEAQPLAATYRAWSLPWPTYFDADLDAFDAFGVITQPTTVYLGEDLRIKSVYPGFPGEALETLPELIERGLGIWSPPVRVRQPLEVRYQPKNGAGPLFHLGRLLLARGLAEKALGTLDRAAAADPDFALAFAAAAFVAHRRGREGDAGERLAGLRSRSGADPVFREALGVALLGLGRDDEAQAALEPLLGEEEPRPRGLVALALLRAQGGDASAADAILRRLGAWPLGGIPMEIDVSAYLDLGHPAAELWAARDELILRLLDLHPAGS